jgi:hypothetical protein
MIKRKEEEHIIPFSVLQNVVICAEQAFKKNRGIHFYKFAIISDEDCTKYHSILIKREDEDD